mgnify:CR=1 FL=1
MFDPAIGVTDDSVIKFDFALHDLAGVIMGIPVYKMLGDSGVNPVPCYDTMILMDDISRIAHREGLLRLQQAVHRIMKWGIVTLKSKLVGLPSG